MVAPTQEIILTQALNKLLCQVNLNPQYFHWIFRNFHFKNINLATKQTT